VLRHNAGGLGRAHQVRRSAVLAADRARGAGFGLNGGLRQRWEGQGAPAYRRRDSIEFPDLGTPGPSLGDELVSPRRCSRRAGGRRERRRLHLRRGSAAYDVLSLHCVATLGLRKGQITLQGLIECRARRIRDRSRWRSPEVPASSSVPAARRLFARWVIRRLCTNCRSRTSASTRVTRSTRSTSGITAAISGDRAHRREGTAAGRRPLVAAGDADRRLSECP
jgi:hypothetical protein